MKTINTILSQTDRALLEDALVHFGRVVTFDQLWTLLRTSVTRAYARRKIALLVQKGWLFRIRKGEYIVITDISSLGSNDLSEYVVAQALCSNSYISMENALQYHGLFDQALRTVRSVTSSRVRSHTVQDTEYIFSQIKDNLYFGFTEEVIGGSYRVKIAEVEKALLDMLYFKTSVYTISVVLEKLTEYKHRVDFAKLQRYATAYGIGMARTVGFLLDQVAIDTDILYRHVKENNAGYTKLTGKSNQFNAKWRVYYDHHLIA